MPPLTGTRGQAAGDLRRLRLGYGDGDVGFFKGGDLVLLRRFGIDVMLAAVDQVQAQRRAVGLSGMPVLPGDPRTPVFGVLEWRLAAHDAALCQCDSGCTRRADVGQKDALPLRPVGSSTHILYIEDIVGVEIFVEDTWLDFI